MSAHPVSVSQPLLTVDEAASYLRVSRRQIYKLVSGGELRTVRVGERLRFRPADVDRYLDRQTATAP
jgi:excisionase family DNA binding protein